MIRMKKIVFALIINFVCSHVSFGQCNVEMRDIRTPMGSEIVTLLESCEMSEGNRLYWDNYYFQNYPNAIQIPTYDGYSSTIKFNCHGYAWIRVEQGIDRWINRDMPGTTNINLGRYMTDGSYDIISQETFPGKVFWTSDDHSAITTPEPGVVISKWWYGPLCRHDLDDSPYGSVRLNHSLPISVKYYVRNCPTFGTLIINLEDEIISTNRTESACSINVKNVQVENGAKLILNTENRTTILKNFKVELGSELEIK